MAEMLPGLRSWTADTVAEVLGFSQYLDRDDSQELYRKLWGFQNKAMNPTPIGSLPVDHDDQTACWWHLLSKREQDAINQAYERYNSLFPVWQVDG